MPRLLVQPESKNVPNNCLFAKRYIAFPYNTLYETMVLSRILFLIKIIGFQSPNSRFFCELYILDNCNVTKRISALLSN